MTAMGGSGDEGESGRLTGDVLRRGNYELFILALSTLSLVNFALQLALPVSETRTVILVVDRGLSLIFLADFAYRLFSAVGKRQYFFGQRGWLDLLGSLPLPVLRLARLFRMVPAARLLRRIGLRRLWRVARQDSGASALLTFVFLTVLLLEGAGVLVLAVERDAPNANIRTASDALWWAYSTVTTVGYGDRFPVTDAGRLVGVVTLTLGVGLFGTLTGFLANAFIRPARGAGEEHGALEVKAEVAELQRRLLALQAGSGMVNAAAVPEDPERHPADATAVESGSVTGTAHQRDVREAS
jgi:voltage-gated potassium channel Kch